MVHTDQQLLLIDNQSFPFVLRCQHLLVTFLIIAPYLLTYIVLRQGLITRVRLGYRRCIHMKTTGGPKSDVTF